MLRSALLHDVEHEFTGKAEGDFRDAATGPGLVARLEGIGVLRTVRQVHGAGVADADSGPAEADALISTKAGTVVAVRVADCVPILLAAPGGVAAVHAGWRGTAAGVVSEALGALRAATRCGFEDVRAAIGPAICGACYEVGPEVVDAVARVAPGDGWRLQPGHVDLAEANAAILRAFGVRVDVLGRCTRCGDGFWSHRRDGIDAGRQVGAIRC